LFNLRGEVVGVTNMKITFGEGLVSPSGGICQDVFESSHAFAYDNDIPATRTLLGTTQPRKKAAGE